ncbi:L,D-transpeptidase [Candidatus Coxiella mudrowiae]|uniref:L,D-transpeptidase n=1 Tax=Candidatus Coxiella mudrowiae TaxID=2054173 RepID=UPI000C286972|nr:L,D-transpeptidase [Candidatus Coxiella mudrowiae]
MSVSNGIFLPIRILKRSTKHKILLVAQGVIFYLQSEELTNRIVYAYENGLLVSSGRVFGGVHYCADIKRSCQIPVGADPFRVICKGPAKYHSTICLKLHESAGMDYCMFFSKYYAISIYGSNHVPAANVSHGCIRVWALR